MKNILVTGSSKGIGESIARAFLETGQNVIINYNSSEQKALELAKELNVTAIKADVSDTSQVDEMFSFIEKKFGAIDVLVNNAGIAPGQSVLQDVTEDVFDRTVAVNLKGVFNCTKRAIPLMVEQKYGNIINISSVWGQIGGSCEAVYSMTKAGIIGFTRAMAKELAPSGICVNAVAPGFIDTDMNAHLSLEDVMSFKNEIPLGRIGTPEDVADVVVFLASSKACYITGQVIGINGGLY